MRVKPEEFIRRVREFWATKAAYDEAQNLESPVNSLQRQGLWHIWKKAETALDDCIDEDEAITFEGKAYSHSGHEGSLLVDNVTEVKW